MRDLFYVNLIIILCTAYVQPLKSGPYYSRMIYSAKCSTNPSKPYDPDPSYKFYGEIYNTTTKSNLFRGNLTVLRDERSLQAKLKGFFLEDGKWKLVIMYSNSGCKSAWMSVLVAQFNLKYNSAQCGIAKGTYIFQNMNEDVLEHQYVSTREYGRMLWQLQVLVRKKTQICWEVINEVVPA